ncbi:DUF1015 domain-containing protein [Eubacteriales bacterium OttesenSCG-928-K08]|nr:DUF1015 domain-containing protein [Eubacteriales bacterium OttesenSCG-928-K08]
MNRYTNNIGVKVPQVLLPDKNADFKKWSVVACDQFTSQPEYWEEAGNIAAGAPSTLNLILPEAYLGKPGEAERIESIKANMREYLDAGVLNTLEPGFVLVRRIASGKERLGLVMALDLEHYDYNKGAKTLIRATEGTIVDRIPPRLRIRQDAPIELPHILVLIDDPGRTVIEPVEKCAKELEVLYDTDLMLDGGHITGYFVNEPELVDNVIAALAELTNKDAFEAKYGAGHAPLLFAMGDGNHSFATAKAAWEAVKATIPEAEWEAHPARYALVEVENVHDAGIEFEPIHRVLFGVDPKAAKAKLLAMLNEQNGNATAKEFLSQTDLDAFVADYSGQSHVLPYYFGQSCGAFVVDKPAQQLSVGTLQNAIDALLKEFPGAEVDYIHGKDVVLELSSREDAMGFLLPAMKKSELFPTVVYDGALPRKTFSMGEANEKRYYMECRRILD